MAKGETHYETVIKYLDQGAKDIGSALANVRRTKALKDEFIKRIEELSKAADSLCEEIESDEQSWGVECDCGELIDDVRSTKFCPKCGAEFFLHQGNICSC